MMLYGLIAAYIALACGLFFFFGYAVRYYLYVAILLLLNVFKKPKNTDGMITRPSLHDGLTAEPLVSIQLPIYNEPNVVERLLTACTTFDYKNYEVILVDDSTDHTLDTLREWAETNEVVHTMKDGGTPTQVQVTNTLASMTIPIKIVHRNDRSGFKGGALNEALKHMDPYTEYVMIFDADFIPPPNIIQRSLQYFAPTSPSDTLTRIAALDRSYADGKLDLNSFVRKRERLANKLRGRTAITESSKLAMQSLFKLDQLFAADQIDEFEYKLRRKAVVGEMAKIPIVASPYADQPLVLRRAFTVCQMFAEDKIDTDDFKTRIHAVFAPFKDKPHPTNEHDKLLFQIINLDIGYADGTIPESEYAERRKELEARLKTMRRGDENGRAESNHVSANIATQWTKDVSGSNENENTKKDTHNNHLRRLLRFLHRGNENGGRDVSPEQRFEYVAVQGYQLHSLNQGENWLTAGVRAEFSGSYMIERPAQELFGSMKMISGSVYMIRADVLRQYKWSNSITEDWELTCRLYLDGKRVAYTPTIAANAECPSTLKRLFKQRQRWAEGHSFNAKKYFIKFMRSPNTTLAEKFEFLYYTPYYIQGLFFIIGTMAWVIQLYTRSYLPFWTALFGWGLLLSNSFAIPLMNFAGLINEGPRKKDTTGVFSAILLSYLVAFFQGYAALRGFLESEEGGWVRTYKTGKITQRTLKIQPRAVVQPVVIRVRRSRSGHVIQEIPATLRRTHATTITVIILAGLLATNFLLAGNVATVQGIPANVKLYPAVDSRLRSSRTDDEKAISISDISQSWTTPTDYSVSSSDAVSGWILHFVCVYNGPSQSFNLTINLYYASESSRGLLQNGYAYSHDLNCDGASENLVQLNPQPWTGTAGIYHLDLEVYSNTPIPDMTMVTGGSHASHLTGASSVPEYVIPLLVLAPLIPIAVKRRRKR
jgi:cellulose synthase/poly-beta-1,6-N-acetylglucosamine synthase-like glycosyltransferase